MIFWNVPAITRHMDRLGIANAKRLSERTGLTIPTAYHVLSGARLERINAHTLETLADLFGVEPWSLLERVR